MKRSKNMRYLRLSLQIFVIAIVFVSVFISPTRNGNAAFSVEDQSTRHISSPTKNEPRSDIRKAYSWNTPFGLESDRFLTDGSLLLSRAEVLGASWVRVNGKVSWRVLQPDPEVTDIDWNKLANFESVLIGMKARGMTPVVVINDHPYWAVKPYILGEDVIYSSCAAIKEDQFPAFASFVQQLVERYSDPQFNVHHWELGNEVDIDPRQVQPDNGFGCWGDKDDPFFGGRHYGEMLKVVTPVIKAADPNATVWMSGLLMDNPNTKPEWGFMGNFLAGILEVGADRYFDILPYHAYFGYANKMVDMDTGDFTSPWYSWGGLSLGKAKYIRQVLAEYRVDKPLVLNEFALNCPSYCSGVTDAYLQMQADQLVRTVTRGLANQIRGFSWYTLDGPGWRNGGLLDSYQDPRPAYFAYQNLAAILAETNYFKPQNYGDGIDAYRFKGPDNFIDVLWAKQDQALTATFRKSNFIEARDRDGTLLTPVKVGKNYQLPVGFSPIYLVFDR